MIAVQLCLVLPVAIGVIGLVAAIYSLIKPKPDHSLAALMGGLVLVMAILTTIVVARVDNLTMSAADSFFKQREYVYRCEGLTEQVCTVKKEIWRKDSLEWIGRLNRIKDK